MLSSVYNAQTCSEWQPGWQSQLSDIMYGDICKAAHFLFYFSWLHVHSSVLNSWQTKKSTEITNGMLKFPRLAETKISVRIFLGICKLLVTSNDVQLVEAYE